MRDGTERLAEARGRFYRRRNFSYRRMNRRRSALAACVAPTISSVVRCKNARGNEATEVLFEGVRAHRAAQNASELHVEIAAHRQSSSLAPFFSSVFKRSISPRSFSFAGRRTMFSPADPSTQPARLQLHMLQEPAAGGVTALAAADLDEQETVDLLAVADLNQDGLMDVVTLDPGAGALRVRLRRDAGGFDALPKVPLAVADTPVKLIAGDFDHDGTTDIRVLYESCHDGFHRNRGDGTLGPPAVHHTVMDPTLDAVVVDMNDDGQEDLVLTGGAGDVDVLILRRDGTVDHDLASKVTVTEAEDGAPAMLRGVDTRVRAWTTDTRQRGQMAVATGDVNGDGRPDLAFAAGNGEVLLHLGE